MTQGRRATLNAAMRQDKVVAIAAMLAMVASAGSAAGEAQTPAPARIWADLPDTINSLVEAARGLGQAGDDTRTAWAAQVRRAEALLSHAEKEGGEGPVSVPHAAAAVPADHELAALVLRGALAEAAAALTADGPASLSLALEALLQGQLSARRRGLNLVREEWLATRAGQARGGFEASGDLARRAELRRLDRGVHGWEAELAAVAHDDEALVRRYTPSAGEEPTAADARWLLHEEQHDLERLREQQETFREARVKHHRPLKEIYARMDREAQRTRAVAGRGAGRVLARGRLGLFRQRSRSAAELP